MRTRGVGPALNFSNLTARPKRDYLLGHGDSLDVTVSDLYPGAEVRPVRVDVMGNGEVVLPLVGAINVGALNVKGAQIAITEAYKDGFLDDPRVNVSLAKKSTVDIVVLGEVSNPGVASLPNCQNDVAHALAMAGGLTDLAADTIEVHRRAPLLKGGESDELERWGLDEFEDDPEDPEKDSANPVAWPSAGDTDRGRHHSESW